MFGRTMGVLLAVLAIAAIAIGCGSSGDDGTGGTGVGGGSTAGETSGSGDQTAGGDGGNVSSTSLSKAQYIKQADAICEKVPVAYRARLAKLPKNQQNNKSIAVPKAVLPPLRAASKELEELGAPSGDEAEAKAIIAALDAAADGVEKEPQSELSGPKSPFVEFSNLTKKYGFEFCFQL